MDRTPAPISVASARQLPWKPGRSAEAFVDGDLEIRFTPRPTNGPQTPHQRDEVYVVAVGSGFYRVDGKRTAVGAGDMCFAAAHALRTCGMQPEVFEAAAALGEIGAAVNVSPQACKALQAIGLGDKVAAVATASPGITRCKPSRITRSPELRPASTTRLPRTLCPSVTSRNSALLSGPTT